MHQKDARAEKYASRISNTFFSIFSFDSFCHLSILSADFRPWFIAFVGPDFLSFSLSSKTVHGVAIKMHNTVAKNVGGRENLTLRISLSPDSCFWNVIAHYDGLQCFCTVKWERSSSLGISYITRRDNCRHDYEGFYHLLERSGCCQ